MASASRLCIDLDDRTHGLPPPTSVKELLSNRVKYRTSFPIKPMNASLSGRVGVAAMAASNQFVPALSIIFVVDATVLSASAERLKHCRAHPGSSISPVP